MYVTKVGELFITGRTRYQEGVYFEYSESGPFLIFALRKLTQAEIEATKTGKVELALYEVPPVLFVLHRIRGLERWSDSPFSIRLYDGRGGLYNWSEPIMEGMGLGLQIVLIDADTGIVKALRLVGTSTEFAQELREAIQRQLNAPFSIDAYDRTINEIYSKYTTDELLALAHARHQAGGGGTV